LTSNDEWMSALALAHRWNFASIRTLALRKLLPLTSPVDQIVLANQYNIDAWKPAAYRQLCEQAFWPSPDDCQRLGLDELIKFGQGWHAMRASTTLIPPSDRDALVTRMFNLPRDVCHSPATLLPFELISPAGGFRRGSAAPERSRGPRAAAARR
jgi:hypothetical protein